MWLELKSCHVYHQGELVKQCNILTPINEIAKKVLQQQFENNKPIVHTLLRQPQWQEQLKGNLIKS